MTTYYQTGAKTKFGYQHDLAKGMFKWNPATPKHFGRGWRKFRVNKSQRQEHNR